MHSLINKTYFDENIKFPLKNEDFYNKIKMFYKHKNSHLTICFALEVLDKNYKSSETEFLPAPVWLNFGKALLVENEKVAAEYAFQKAISEYNSLLEIYPNDNEHKFNLASLFAYFDDLNSVKSILDSYLIFNSSKYVFYGFGFEKYKKDRNWQNYLFSDKNRIERVLKFSEIAKNEYNSISSNFDLFQSGLDFILENSDKFPENPQNADETYVFFHFIDLLNPIVFWTNLDLRILKVIQANYVVISHEKEYGLFENFISYIYSHCYNENNYSKENINRILNKLIEKGFDEIILVKSLIIKEFHELFDEKYKITGYGSFVASYYFSPQPNEILIQTIKKHYDSKKLEILLFLFDSEEFENKGFLENINFKDPEFPKDKNLHCNLELFKILYFNYLEKYQSFLEHSYLQVTDIKSINDINNFLAENQFPNYKALIISHFEKNFEFILESYKKSKNYKIYIPKELVYSLIKHCPLEAKSLIFKWFPKLNDKELYDYNLLEQKFQEESIPILIESFRQSEFSKSSVFEIIEKYDLSEYSEVFREKLKTYTKFPQEICNILVKNGDSEIPFAIELINNHSLQKQSLGLQILDSLNSEKSLQVIENLYFETQNADLRDLILEKIVQFKPEFNQNISWENVQNRINFALQNEKLNQPILEELNEINLPILKWKNENSLTETEIRYLFYRQSKSNFIFPELELKPILEHIDLKSSKEFGLALWEIYLKLESKPNFLLVLCAIFAEDHLIEPIFNQISTLIEDKKAKKTDELVLVFGLIATPKALRILDNFARKYKSKYKNIGETAQKTFENIAFDKNLTEFELADYLIPNFGFNEAYEVFKINDKKYMIIVDSNLDLVFLEDNGRKLKKLPLGADTEIVARVKEINKEIKDSIPALKYRMETYMINQRKWNFPEWKKVYVNNPIIFPFLNSLIWGVFENNQLIQTFITSETFMNSDYKPIEIFENQQVGIIHPAILGFEELINWQSYINDNVTLQSFDQVFRKVFIFEKEKIDMKYDISYSKLKFESLKFTRTLESRGWERGSIKQGYINSYFKLFKEQNIAAFINLSGYFKGYFDDDEYGDSGISAIYFVKPESVKIDSYLESEPDNMYDERLIPFGKISKVIYSEILRDLNYFISKD